ncbi:phosphotransferase family protein [Subtercola lobariae]|uniref:Acyl-CoA dehydrogenase n=1 Tax=Subtercola lobariae TaxID=1588641 RepID=A0A917F1T2_9MICO|nr:phosphotransferase family protein [Subtercola lobariae]GGF41667.1 acyl-CoA dehydrogenase [Subtercola lobariae]
MNEPSVLATTDTPGVDLGRLTQWFASHSLAGPLTAQLIAGGKSNLTYDLSDGTTSWVLRRPPLGHVLATAHDMAREYRVMSALGNTDVPVPATYGLCTDDAVIGAPFYLMQKIEGVAFRTADELVLLGYERVRTISLRLVDALVALHRVDPVSVGLGDFGRSEGFLERQVRRWGVQLDRSRSRELPDTDALRAALAAGIPEQSAPGIVHGDYRLDNVLIDTADRPAAIIDWEMATIGDPITDLALMIVYQKLSRLPGSAAVFDAAAAPGYIGEDEVRERYISQGGRDTPNFAFYLGLAAFKLAVIAEGITYRHRLGQTEGTGFDGIDVLTEPVARIGLAALKENH